MSNQRWFPDFWQALGLLLLFMLASLIAGLPLLLGFAIPGYLLFPLIYALPFLLALPLFFFFYKKWNQQAVKFRFSLPAWPMSIMLLAIAFGVIKLSNLLAYWLSQIGVLNALNEATSASFAKMYRHSLWGFFFSTVLLAPFLEEVLFRGYFLKSFLKNYKPWVAISLSALLFGLLHGNPQQFIAAFTVGLLLGYTYWRTHSLLTPILIHLLNNLSAFLWLVYQARRVGLTQAMNMSSVSFGETLWILAAGLAALVLWYFVERFYQNRSDGNRIRHT